VLFVRSRASAIVPFETSFFERVALRLLPILLPVVKVLGFFLYFRTLLIFLILVFGFSTIVCFIRRVALFRLSRLRSHFVRVDSDFSIVVVLLVLFYPVF